MGTRPMTLKATSLATTYPCCKGAARIPALEFVPVERYERVCPRCGRRWDVRREILRDDAGVRMDLVEWEG